MFCHKCGTQNPEGSQFCANCGELLVVESNNRDVLSQELHSLPASPLKGFIGDLPEVEISNSSVVHCPQCKSVKMQALTESDVKGGYRAGNGFLGWLLFGPVGLLFGSMGKKSKITVKNTTMFVCMECGFKFKRPSDMIVEKQQAAKLSKIIGIALLVLGLIMLFKNFVVFLFCIAIGGGCLFTSGELKEECGELEKKGYDAACYLKK